MRSLPRSLATSASLRTTEGVNSRSERPSEQGSITQDVGDRAALIEHLAPSSSHIVGNSLGAVIALRLAAEKPALVRSLSVQAQHCSGCLQRTLRTSRLVTRTLASRRSSRDPDAGRVDLQRLTDFKAPGLLTARM
jgi:pimeloyl-ACP methyl ester carboxylesterase